MATLLRTDGTTSEVQPENGTDFKFAEVYKLIDCDMIQIVHTDNGLLMLIDEDGKNKDKPVNRTATTLYVHGGSDDIMGDVLVCEPHEVQ